MSDDFSARLALPYLAAGQMQKHVTLNTALTRLDALLQAARREEGGRGRLKIFLGAAPGVGKTYEMLTVGRARLKAGTDVVVGVVETHGRAETEALRLEGDHRRLEADRQLQATNLRVERTARERLKMSTATPAVTMYEGQQGSPASAALGRAGLGW